MIATATQVPSPVTGVIPELRNWQPLALLIARSANRSPQISTNSWSFTFCFLLFFFWVGGGVAALGDPLPHFLDSFTSLLHK